MPNKKKRKVLIVEDDVMILNMYKTKLEQDGFAVLTADNGVLGLELAQKEAPDMIMMDIILPQMDGFSVLAALKAGAKTKKIPVIMLTNLGTGEDRKKGKKLGAADYLVKADLTPAQVSAEIKKHLK